LIVTEILTVRITCLKIKNLSGYKGCYFRRIIRSEQAAFHHIQFRHFPGRKSKYFQGRIQKLVDSRRHCVQHASKLLPTFYLLVKTCWKKGLALENFCGKEQQAGNALGFITTFRKLHWEFESKGMEVENQEKFTLV
jgi:hypothetical protein